jgi:hypothetical protein
MYYEVFKAWCLQIVHGIDQYQFILDNYCIIVFKSSFLGLKAHPSVIGASGSLRWWWIIPTTSIAYWFVSELEQLQELTDAPNWNYTIDMTRRQKIIISYLLCKYKQGDWIENEKSQRNSVIEIELWFLDALLTDPGLKAHQSLCDWASGSLDSVNCYWLGLFKERTRKCRKENIKG